MYICIMKISFSIKIQKKIVKNDHIMHQNKISNVFGLNMELYICKILGYI